MGAKVGNKNSRMKLQRLRTRNYDLKIMIGGDPISWFVRNRDTLADTADSNDLEAYKGLKRVWRKSKEGFDMRCAAMKFRDLFNHQEVKL